MAVDIFLEIKGVEGEHESKANAIEVLALSWGMTQTGNFHSGGGGGAGKVNVQDLTVTKYIDKASTKMMQCCAQGDHFPEAVLTIRKAGGKSPIDYLKITLKKVIVNSISLGGTPSDDRFTETVGLHFAEVAVDYQMQGADGSGKPAGNFAWNIAKNTK